MFVIMNKVGGIYETGSQWLEKPYFDTKEEAREFLFENGYKPISGNNVYHKPATKWLYAKTARIEELVPYKKPENWGVK